MPGLTAKMFGLFSLRILPEQKLEKRWTTLLDPCYWCLPHRREGFPEHAFRVFPRAGKVERILHRIVEPFGEVFGQEFLFALRFRKPIP